MISAIFTSAASVISGLTTLVAQAFTNIAPVFYNATDGLTLIGQLLTMALGCGVCWFGFRLIKGLVKHPSK